MTFEHHASFPLPVSPDRAFRALVEPGELTRWFAEHARVEPRSGGAFRFWGRATPGIATEREAAQQLVAFEPGRALAFSWSLWGVATEVRWTVIADDAGSKLEIAHAVSGALPFANGAHVIDDLWRMHASNLAEHLRGGDNVVLADFATDKPEIRLSIEIAAPPAKVFRALLDPKILDRWLKGAAKVDVATRAYSYGWSYEVEGRKVDGGPGKILELVENQKLVHDWTDWRGDPAKPLTRVTWLLDALAGGTRTRLTIIHDGFEHPVDRSDYQQGWGGFLEALPPLVADA
jgi:uncharacterized protein YndB with AHSA1/START domain